MNCFVKAHIYRRWMVRIVITGSAGSLARDVIPGLLKAGHAVHGIDRMEPKGCALAATLNGNAIGRYTYTQLDLAVCPRDELLREISGADAIIHLAGIPLEDRWENLSSGNVDVTHLVCSVAVECGIRRVVLASSIHATGLTPIPGVGERLKPTIPTNPNTLYGVSKVTLEGLGKYFAEQHGLEVVALRICSRMAQPLTTRHLSTWLSPADATLLCAAAVSGTLPARYWAVWGVSNNDRSWFDLEPGHAIGFTPKDNAEDFAEQIENVRDDSLVTAYTTIGGEFSTSNPPSMKRKVNSDE